MLIKICYPLFWIGERYSFYLSATIAIILLLRIYFISSSLFHKRETKYQRGFFCIIPFIVWIILSYIMKAGMGNGIFEILSLLIYVYLIYEVWNFVIKRYTFSHMQSILIPFLISNAFAILLRVVTPFIGK